MRDWKHGGRADLVGAHCYDIAGQVCEEVGAAKDPCDHHPAQLEVCGCVWDHRVNQTVDPNVSNGFDGPEDAVVVHEDRHIAEYMVGDGIGDEVVTAVEKSEHVDECNAVAPGVMHESVLLYVTTVLSIHASQERCEVRAS